MPRDIRDPEDRMWTLDMAAEHVGISRKTVQKYVREGLPLESKLLGGIVDRDKFLAEYRKRILKQRDTRYSG